MRQVFKQSFSDATDITGHSGTALLLDKLDSVVTAADVYKKGDVVYVEVDNGSTSYRGRQTIKQVAPDGNKQMVLIDAAYDGNAKGTIEKLGKEPGWAADTSFGRTFLAGSLLLAAIIFAYTAFKTQKQ